MKVRMGFVTNSSSSNFIIAGWSSDRVEYDEELTIKLGMDRDVIYDPENGLLGIWLRGWEDEIGNYVTLKLSEILSAVEKTEKLDEIKKHFGISGEAKIIAGTRNQ